MSGQVLTFAMEIFTVYHGILFLHLLAATVWTGGHLVLVATVLPRALRARNPRILLDFEQGYEKIGMPALLIQVATGLWMAHQQAPVLAHWLAPTNPVESLIRMKLGLLAITVLTALDARLRIIPNLTAQTLPAMARRIALVSTVSVAFVVVGVSFRSGWLV
jgi:putative copper export protein